MIKLYESNVIGAAPNTVVYTAVINACAYSENDDTDRSAALRIAIRTFKDLEKSSYGRPNHVTYANLLTALRNLLPPCPKRNVAIQDIFQSAVQNGCVDEIVLQRAQCKYSRVSLVARDCLWQLVSHCAPRIWTATASLSPEAFQVLCLSLHGGGVNLDKLPKKWSRNVRLDRP
jgi:hypothetical protein